MKVQVHGLRHVYGSGSRSTGPSALDVSALSVESTSRLCLVGGSGSGKSTLLNVIAGLLVPRSGKVRLDGVDLFALGEAQRDRLRSRSIGCIFQTFNLLQGLSALENLTLAQRFAGIPQARAKARALELLEQLGLRERGHARPAELSVGEQQRVAIARAVSKSPGLVLADEPTASLDDDSARAAIDLLLAACEKSTLIVVTHDPRLASRFAIVEQLSELRSPS